MIINSDPVVVPATEEQIFDAWVITHMAFLGEGIERPAEAKIYFRRGHKKEDGTWVLSNRLEDKKEMYIDNIWTEAFADPVVLEAMTKFLNAIKAIGIRKGIL